MRFEHLKLTLLHDPRTGLTSVEHAFSGGDREGFEWSVGFPNKHLDAARAGALWEDDWNNPQWTWAVCIRNPLHLVPAQYCLAFEKTGRTVSAYRQWVKARDKAGLPLLIKSAETDNLFGQLSGVGGLPSAGMSQCRFIQHNPRLKPRKLTFLFFEDLQKDFNMLCDMVGFPRTELENRGGGKSPDHLGEFPTVPDSDPVRIDYDAMNDDETAAIIAHNMAADLIRWKYPIPDSAKVYA